MYIKLFQIGDRTVEFDKGLNVLVHDPETCQISSKFLKALDAVCNGRKKARNISGVTGLELTFSGRIASANNKKVWRVILTTEMRQVVLNAKPYDRSKLQTDLTNEGMVFYFRDKPLNLITISSIDKAPAVDSRANWLMICEAFLHHQLADHFDDQIDTSRKVCEVMMYSKHYELELGRLREELAQHKATTDEYRAVEKRLYALQTVIFKKAVRGLQARQAAFQQSLDHDVEVLTPVLDEIEESEEQQASLKLAVEQQSIALQNLWHHLQAEVTALEIELDELKSARQLALEYSQRRQRLWVELETIKTEFIPREEEEYAKMYGLTRKRYTLDSERYSKLQLKAVILYASVNQEVARQEQLSMLHRKIRELSQKQSEQEDSVSDFMDELRQRERKFANVEKNLVETAPLKNIKFAELLDLKLKMFELQRKYAENQLKIAKLSVQLPALAASIDEKSKAFEKRWRIEPETITVLNYVECFIQSLPETEQVRIEYMGPLFRQMSMDDDDAEEFGMAYEIVKECLFACLFRTHATMLRASGMFRGHMLGQYGRSDMFVYTFMALGSGEDIDNDITMLRGFIPFAELLDDECELRRLLQFRRLVMVDHSLLATTDPQFIAELDEAGYCVLSLDNGVDGLIVQEHGVLCAAPVADALTFSRFKAELGVILDKKFLLGTKLAEKMASVDTDQRLCEEIDEQRREIETARVDLPRLHYNIHNYLMELFRIRRESRDAKHSLEMVEIDLRVHRAVLVDKRQLECDIGLIVQLSREIDNLETESDKLKELLDKDHDLQQFSDDIKPHLEEMRSAEKSLNFDLLLNEHVDVDAEQLDAMINACEEQLVHLSWRMGSAVREMWRCVDKLLEDNDECQALTVRARLDKAKHLARCPNRTDRAELNDLRYQLKDLQIKLNASRRRASDVDINANTLNEVISDAAATKRQLNAMPPPTSQANYDKIINNLNIIEQIEQTSAVNASALGHQVAPFFDKLTLKNIDVVMQMMTSTLRLVTDADYRCTFDVDHAVGTTLRVRDIRALAVHAPTVVSDYNNLMELVDDKYLKMVFFVCLMVVNKIKFIFIENLDKLVAPELMQKTLMFLKAFGATTQIVVTLQAKRTGKCAKKMAPPCNCFKMGGKEPRTKRKTGRLQKRRTDEPCGQASNFE